MLGVYYCAGTLLSGTQLTALDCSSQPERCIGSQGGGLVGGSRVVLPPCGRASNQPNPIHPPTPSQPTLAFATS